MRHSLVRRAGNYSEWIAPSFTMMASADAADDFITQAQNAVKAGQYANLPVRAHSARAPRACAGDARLYFAWCIIFRVS